MSGIEDYYHTETDEAPKLDMKPAMPVDIHKDVRRRPKALDVFMFGNIVYCGSWVRTGACNGCVSTHMMPSISDMKKIGYSRYPSWYRQKIDIQHDLRDGKLKAAPELPYNSNLESFCAQWIQTGKCEFQERGTECLLEHIMPNPQVLEFMGHTEYPKWFIETDWSEEVNKSGSDSLHESADQRGNACSLSFCSSYAGPSTSSPTRILQNPTENSTSRAPQAQHVLYHDSGYPSIAREVEYPPAFWSHRLDHLSESAKFRNVVGLPQGADAAEQSESETHLHGAKKDENTLELVDKILPQSVESSSSRSDHESITVPNTTNTPNGGGMLVPMNGDVDEPLARHRRYVPPTVQDEQQSPSESSIKALAEKTRRREANYASQLSGYSSF
ncbi:hypothetical protein MMC18_002955 [Xylographa bjoerkii]|nr:hypothetical protein [Xylographa bjoerkii]